MRYAKYKPTGIAWLPEVPEEWEVRRLKSLFVQRNESYDPNEKLIVLSLLKDVGVIPYDEKGLIGNKSKDDYSSYNVARKGDVVMNSMNVIIGSVDITPYDGYISPAYYALTARDNVDTRYYNYIFHLTKLQKAMRALAKGILEIRLRISTTSLFGMAYPYPPLPTQRAIVAFLDEKCGKVDRLVAAKEKEVALLKELKQSVIAEAVTRGVAHVEGADHDLTQRAQSLQSASSPRSLRSPRENNRRLVPSGIPWLPEVPEGWEVKKVRQLARESKTKNKNNVETNVLSLSYGRIIRKKDVYSGLVPTDFATYQIVEPDYVVLRLTDLQNDHRSLRCGLVKERGIITSAYVSIVPQNILPAYLYLALHTCDLHKLFYSMGGGLRQSMNFADVANIFIPVPPLAEQREIVGYVEAKTKRFAALVAGLEKEIAALKEYKQRLIADVVTGQRKVGKALDFSVEGA